MIEFIEYVSTDEVIWRLLKGPWNRCERQTSILLDARPNLLLNPNLDDWEENMIRRGALSLCEPDDCPIVSLILRGFPKSRWTDELEFSRGLFDKQDFLQMEEVNYDKKLFRAIKKYKDNKKVGEVRDTIQNGTFDFGELGGIIAYNVNSTWSIIDGVHGAMAIAFEVLENNIPFPEIKVICLENKIKIKRKSFIFKKQYILDGN